MRTLPRFIGLLQVDSTVGNLTGNASRIERLASIAKEHGALMAVSTELAISGYPPRDLLLQPDFINMSFDRATSLNVEITAEACLLTELCALVYSMLNQMVKTPIELLLKSSYYHLTMYLMKHVIFTPLIVRGFVERLAVWILA